MIVDADANMNELEVEDAEGMRGSGGDGTVSGRMRMVRVEVFSDYT